MSRAGGVALAMLLAACTPSSGSATNDSAGAGASSSVGIAPAPAASPLDTVPSHTDETRQESGSIPPAGNASSAKGPRVTGGPERAPVPPRNSGCGGTFITVTVKASALGNSSDAATLRAAASEILAPVQPLVGAPTVSPAIRAFRVAVKDSASASRVLAAMRASPRVEEADIDACIGRQ